MKKIFSIAVILLTTNVILPAQSLDDVLKEHFSSIGQDKVTTLNDMKTTGRMVQMGLEIPFIQMSARPNFIRVEGTLQGLTFIQTYNGTEGWNLNPFTGATEPQPFSEDELKSMKYQADMDGMLWNWKEKGYTVTLEDKQDVEGTDCYQVKLVTVEDDTFTHYIDSESYMLIRTNAKVKVQGNETEADTYYSNYKQVEGMAIPGKVETKMDGQTLSTIIMDTIEINVGLDKALFGKPEKK